MTRRDFAAEGLLDGLEGAERAARRELLEQLDDAGVSLEELRAAVAEDRLALLPVELVLRGESKYTQVEVAERSGLSVEIVSRQRQALGLTLTDPEARVHGDRDLEAAGRLAAFRRAGFPEEGTLEVTRVIGQSMARVAEAVRTLVAESLVRPGDTERELGLRYAELARSTAPLLGETLEYVLNAHLREQMRSDFVTQAELASGRRLPGSREITVCFADLVGFTRLGEQVPPDELGAVAGRLAEMASDRAKPPVRLIKTIGDAAMLVSDDGGALLETALDLAAAADAEGERFPALSAGLASGTALTRGGDWYGHPVNLASRITGIARPGSVLASAEVRAAAREQFKWSFAGERGIKGVARPVRLFRARRSAPETDAP